jgi:hypothetical protein
MIDGRMGAETAGMGTQNPPRPLVKMLGLANQVALAPEERRRGRPCRYPERLFVKLVIVMVVRDVYRVYSVLALWLRAYG